ncbi:polyphosphate kinase 2 [Aquibium carbonis]|uniref:ADP/GDP-polyphosphate phosphotransferase n=1 Tax=Aquibium carbonis TaxID=2495581 RepID=A0A429YZK9_9HYPH|nr:polyphosphate kinase 2 [Aquibium carbonis]RST86896.1 polyphosphate kinase 2 [Aquibium carbonis]
MTTRPSPEMPANEPVRIMVDGKERVFDIDDPKLPGWVEDRSMSAGGYPYDKKMDKKEYEETLENLQVELVKLQYWLQSTGKRVMVLFEGRDAAGKGGTIFVVRQYMNPRSARNVALTKPTETERGQWYYQRYVAHFPTAGEFVTFDRSWYNRAGVEPVMGFCTPRQHELFLEETPKFEQMIVDEGIHFFKFWLNIGQETQLERFHDRRHDPLKVWKFSPIDLAGMTKWDDYTRARDRMMKHTHTDHAPWTVLRANDKRRSRLAAIRRILKTLPYDGRDDAVIGLEDEKIVCPGSDIIGK